MGGEVINTYIMYNIPSRIPEGADALVDLLRYTYMHRQTAEPLMVDPHDLISDTALIIDSPAATRYDRAHLISLYHVMCESKLSTPNAGK